MKLKQFSKRDWRQLADSWSLRVRLLIISCFYCRKIVATAERFPSLSLRIAHSSVGPCWVLTLQWYSLAGSYMRIRWRSRLLLRCECDTNWTARWHAEQSREYREWQNAATQFTCNFIGLRKRQTKPNNFAENNVFCVVFVCNNRVWMESHVMCLTSIMRVLDLLIYILFVAARCVVLLVASYCRRVSNAIATMLWTNLAVLAVAAAAASEQRNSHVAYNGLGAQ